MIRILVFYPSNKRTIQLETTILAIHRRGVEIELLTTCEPGPLHEFLSSQGVPTHAHPLSKRWSFGYYVRQIRYLAQFCRKRDFTTVFSNLQHANFIAVFAQYLSPAKFVIFRHHFNFALPGEDIPLKPNRMERIFDRVINRLARKIVVPSSGVYEGMRTVEHADMSRVTILPYMYEFDRYGQPNPEAVDSIRSQYPAQLDAADERTTDPVQASCFGLSGHTRSGPGGSGLADVRPRRRSRESRDWRRLFERTTSRTGSSCWDFGRTSSTTWQPPTCSSIPH